MDTQTMPTGVRAVVFDVGETLVDESRMWAEHARSVGVTPFTLMAVIGALIERGEEHHGAWGILGSATPSAPVSIGADDLYPDALDCLQAARSAGYVVAIAGNQPAGAVACGPDPVCGRPGRQQRHSPGTGRRNENRDGAPGAMGGDPCAPARSRGSRPYGGFSGAAQRSVFAGHRTVLGPRRNL